jgi:hypothetical protein
MGITEIAGEFKKLDTVRRKRGLSLNEAEQYRSLFERLSEALSAGERKRKADERQFLRVQAPMEIVLRVAGGEMAVTCGDFGGGGCCIRAPVNWPPGTDLWLDGAILDGKRLPLHGRAVVVWSRADNDSHLFGLRFAIDSPKMRDEVDRLLYAVLDRFLVA